MEKSVIIIPTYWGRPVGEVSKLHDSIFDHPTPIDGESTLSRLLDSLCELNTRHKFSILIIVAVVSDTLISDVIRRVNSIIDLYRNKLDLTQISTVDLAPYKQSAWEIGFDPVNINLSTYAGVRNMQLIVPHKMGAEVIIALDDDEVVKPDFLDIALSTLNTDIIGAAGFYEDGEGRIEISEPDRTGNIFLDKAFFINDGVRALLKYDGRYVKSNMAFGGNMIFHQKLFMKVGFDPSITRGEDLDYVINAKLAGIDFYLDKKMRITHLPPRHYESSVYAKMAEDIRRFIYEREKLFQSQYYGQDSVQLEYWMPYPGRFFKHDVEVHAINALSSISTSKDIELWGTPENILESALSHAAEKAPKYFEFARLWPRYMDFIIR